LQSLCFHIIFTSIDRIISPNHATQNHVNVFLTSVMSMRNFNILRHVQWRSLAMNGEWGNMILNTRRGGYINIPLVIKVVKLRA